MFELTVLLSHVHWDHIQGLPFFAPIYIPGTRLVMAGGATGTPLSDTLRRQMSAPTFPVDWKDVPAAREYVDMRDGVPTRLGDAEVRTVRANHPDAVYVALSRDADVLVYDAQYLPEEYAGKVGWGHSTYEAGAALATAAGVRKLVLFHHDPTRIDADVEAIEKRARDVFGDVVAAREGMTIELGESSSIAA